MKDFPEEGSLTRTVWHDFSLLSTVLSFVLVSPTYFDRWPYLSLIYLTGFGRLHFGISISFWSAGTDLYLGDPFITVAAAVVVLQTPTASTNLFQSQSQSQYLFAAALFPAVLLLRRLTCSLAPFSAQFPLAPCLYPHSSCFTLSQLLVWFFISAAFLFPFFLHMSLMQVQSGQSVRILNHISSQGLFVKLSAGKVEVVPTLGLVGEGGLGPEPTPTLPHLMESSLDNPRDRVVETEIRSYAPPPTEWEGGRPSPCLNKVKGIGEVPGHPHGLGNSDGETLAMVQTANFIPTQTQGTGFSPGFPFLNQRKPLTLPEAKRNKLDSDFEQILFEVRCRFSPPNTPTGVANAGSADKTGVFEVGDPTMVASLQNSGKFSNPHHSLFHTRPMAGPPPRQQAPRTRPA